MVSKMESVVQERVRAAVNEAQSSLLGALNQLMSSKLDSMQNKISENQQKLSISQMAKIQSNNLTYDGYNFKRKGCEDQFKFNIKVMDKLQDAESAHERTQDSASLAAREKNCEGKEISSHRQTLIKVADDTELGWKTVKEYEVNPLVEDSDDEKRLMRA